MNTFTRLWRSPSRSSKSGFTLVELLVVIAIIGVLVALLLPAVQAARAAARRTQCQSNLKQVGLAVLNYESANKALPALMSWFDDGDPNTSAKRTDLGPNWVIDILPFLEQQATYDAFDFTVPITNTLNELARSNVISPLLCPEDTENNSVKFSGENSRQLSEFGDNWARGNYGANGGLYFTPSGDFNVDTWLINHWADATKRGVLAPRIRTKLSRITDGTSNTILAGEIRAGVSESDLRGTWAMSGACPSGLAAHGWFGDDNGPNNLELFGDDVIGCSDLKRSLTAETLVRDKMGCSNNGVNWQQTLRSRHVGGGHICLLDGSVQFLRDDIEISQNNECCSTWDRLNLSADGEIVEADSF